ncbi:MAG: hypothetical protein Q7T55_15835, partial [Solirubrobacteraceae bacterium]|nr:hypothetical protein [Solirubrobacteraceae bacterium]
DQTIFQAVGAQSILDEYQSYDKALDVYYLTVAYASTLRNWLDPTAIGIARFLFYFRIVGVVAFELTAARPILVIFPNTFEYFFIAYELIRLFWDPNRLPRRVLLAIAAAIWILIKLPQELWLHVLELDVTDTVQDHVWVAPAVGAAAIVLLLAAVPFVRRLPPPDREVHLDVDTYLGRPASSAVRPRTDTRAILSVAVLEKVLLISMVVVIFSQIIPGVNAGVVQLSTGVATVVVLNSVVSLWRVRHGSRWASTAAQFGAMMTVNLAIVGVLRILPERGGREPVPTADTLVLLLLITLIITLYDRYRVIGNLSKDESPLTRHGPPAAVA